MYLYFRLNVLQCHMHQLEQSIQETMYAKVAGGIGKKKFKINFLLRSLLQDFPKDKGEIFSLWDLLKLMCTDPHLKRKALLLPPIKSFFFFLIYTFNT